MKKSIAVLLLSSISAAFSAAAELHPKFLHALNMVEANGRDGHIIGDNGKALGPYQIHYSYWLNANVVGCYSMVTNRAYAAYVVTAYMNRFAKSAIVNNNFEVLARIHNGGPIGHKKRATKTYWLRIRKYLHL